jgi:hypothetical protein
MLAGIAVDPTLLSGTCYFSAMALFQSAVLKPFLRQQAKAHALQAEIDRTDAAIDALVYQLYGLTEAEVKVVEGK